jgi:ferritin-like protein
MFDNSLPVAFIKFISISACTQATTLLMRVAHVIALVVMVTAMACSGPLLKQFDCLVDMGL